MSKSVSPPAGVRGMKWLDREAFRTKVQIRFVELMISETVIAPVLAALKPYLLKLPHLKPFSTNSRNVKRAYLDPHRFHAASVEDVLRRSGLRESDFCVGEELVEFNYGSWTAEDIFRAVLPQNISFSSYSMIGHIVLLNLKQNLLPYKELIGEVLLDKVPRCKTVLSKTGTAIHLHRSFNYEHLAGELSYLTMVQENGFQYEFDFMQVFWDPRLCTERARILSKFAPGDIVFDVFAGVGPLSIPAAAKHCTVVANDANPYCAYWMRHNCGLNKMSFEVHCLEGNQFLTEVCPMVMRSRAIGSVCGLHVHVVMDLPALSLHFLPFLYRIRTAVPVDIGDVPPVIYVYCYMLSKADDPLAAATDAVLEKLPGVCIVNPSVHEVRLVSPGKRMLCVSFTLLGVRARVWPDPLVEECRKSLSYLQATTVASFRRFNYRRATTKASFERLNVPAS